MLDPNNPRSVAYQIDRIETHLAALPKGQTAAGRLTPVQQVAASIATRFRTADAGNIDDAQIIEIEDSLMKLSEAIATTYLTHIERVAGGVGCAVMIYDIRQTTSCTYASPVTNAYHVLRQTPVNRPGQRVQVSSLRIEPEPKSWREGQDFFGNRLTWIALEEAHDDFDGEGVGAHRGRCLRRADPMRPHTPGKPCRKKSSPRPTSGRWRRRISCFRAAWCRSIPRSAITRGKVFRPAARCWKPPPT